MEPNTGNPLVGHKRVQFNMFLRPITGLPLTENIIPTLMPVLWVNEGIELNEGMVDLLRTTLVNRLILVDAIHWTLFALGLAMFLVFGIWFFVTRNSSGSNNF